MTEQAKVRGWNASTGSAQGWKMKRDIRKSRFHKAANYFLTQVYKTHSDIIKNHTMLNLLFEYKCYLFS